MSDTATFELHGNDSRATLTVAGEVDLITAVEFRRLLRTALQSYDDVVVDLSAVTFFSSAGVGVLATTLPSDGRTVSLADMSAAVRRTLDVLGRPPHLKLLSSSALA